MREESANKLIKSIGCEDVETVLDPVYLLDSYQWSEFAKEIVAPKYSYVLLYAVNCTREIADYAYELSRRKGKKLIIINTMVNDFRFKADYHVWQKSPEYFVKIFENADEVITNSFHGFSFSVLFKKQVYIFSKKTGGNSRLFNLMNSLQIADCRKGELIDYNKVYEILESKIKKSKLFVESIITYETKE